MAALHGQFLISPSLLIHTLMKPNLDTEQKCDFTFAFGCTFPICGSKPRIVTILEGAEVRIGFYGRGGRILRGFTSEGAEGPEGWPRG